MNDPIYNSLIAKILEAKALDCLCAGYSKQNTQKQISQALAEINERLLQLFLEIFFHLFKIEMMNINGILQVLHHHHHQDH